MNAQTDLQYRIDVDSCISYQNIIKITTTNKLKSKSINKNNKIRKLIFIYFNIALYLKYIQMIIYIFCTGLENIITTSAFKFLCIINFLF